VKGSFPRGACRSPGWVRWRWGSPPIETSSARVGEEGRSLQPAVQRSHDERCPSGSGRGSARARRLARASGSELVGCGFGLVRPLARETPAGGCRRKRSGLRPLPLRRTAPPVLGAGSPAARLRPGLRRSAASGARKRTLVRALAVGAGIGRSAVVLADRFGCRSRRAALGPGRKAMGLARWLPAHAGELSERKRAGSRVAAAKAVSTRAATPVAGSS